MNSDIILLSESAKAELSSVRDVRIFVEGYS